MGYKHINRKAYKPVHLLSLCLGLILYACEREDMTHSNQGIPAIFTPTMEPTTRVDNNVWSGTETVGIYSITNGGTLPADAAFKTYKPSGSGTRVQLNPTAEDQTIYYPADGTEVNFIAFAPYTEAPHSTRNGNVVTYMLNNQSAKMLMEKFDLIYHNGSTAYSESNPIAALRFEHKLSRIIINITRGASFVHNLTEITNFGIQNVPVRAGCNLATGAVTASVLGTILPYKATNLATNAVYQAVIPAHTASASYSNRRISFTLGGNNYTYALEQAFEAGNSYTYNFTLTPQGIVLTGDAIAPWGVGTVAWSGDYYLGVSESTISLYKEATTNNTLTITTNHNNTPVVNRSSSATSINNSCSWITLGSVSGTSSPYTSTYSVTENTTGATREGYLHVTVGTMTTVVKIEQKNYAEPITNGDTNCFMVVPGTKIKFPLSRPIAQGTAAANATFTIEKLWDDTAGGAVKNISVSGTGSNAYVTVTAGDDPGNAVIAAKVNGVIVWSYHIWVTGYMGYPTWENIYNTNNNGNHFVFMDRNLGATFAGTGSGIGTGLFYQWGRKDPFPATLAPGATQPGGGRFTAAETTVALGTVANTIRNPNVFYLGVSASDYDWLYAGRNNTLWGHGIGTAKSVYDPCPAGWRVPSFNVASNEFPVLGGASPWFGFSDATVAELKNTPANLYGSWSNGHTWGTSSSNISFPATGIRERSSGTLKVVGGHAYYWSASPYDPTFTLGLYFHTSYVSVSNSYYRSEGLSVRCVKI